jgi:cyanophycin synthetase
MRLQSIRTFTGPTVHTDRPSVRAHLLVSDGPDPAGVDPAAVGAALADMGLPTSSGDGGPAPVGLGAIVAEAAVGLAAHAGLHCECVHVGDGPEPGVCEVVVAYAPQESEAAVRRAIEAAAEVVEATASGATYPVDEALADVRRLAERESLGPTTRAIVEAAERRGIPWERLDDASLVRLGWGKAARYVRASITSQSSHIAVDIASDKRLATALLSNAFLPVPRGEVVSREGSALAAARRVGYPVVVKPLDGNHGRGVSVGLRTPEAVAEAFRIAREHGRRVIVEETFTGRDYRVLVVGGKMVAAAERRPAEVVGDGVHTVEELVEAVNQDPRRGDGHAREMTRICLDDVARAYLASAGVSLTGVPAAGETVPLCRTANLSRGGTAHDVTDRVHPSARIVCERAARIVGLDVCGVDLVTEDIAAPLTQGGIVEVNAAPGLRMHLAPAEGEPRDVGGAVVDALFPPGVPVRVPLIAITGTNGKTSTSRMIGHVLGREGLTVGMTSTEGVWVGGELVAGGDTTGPQSARAVLADPSVEVAVLETARGGIVRRGLAWDGADVAVMTNIREDHVGQDGIRTIDDIYRIKRLVAERVRAGGTLVLNADDPLLAALPDDPAVSGVEREVVFFSLQPGDLVRRHCASGGRAFYVVDRWIVEADGGVERPVVPVATLPVTMGGAARFHVENALAACAALRAHGVPAERIAEGLRHFHPAEHNAGRANLYRLGAGYVLLDYGHNPDGFEAVCRMAEHWGQERNVTGIVGVPGDREDAAILDAGRTAARWFGRVVVRENADLRGRRPGETAELLCRAVADERPGLPCETVLDGAVALRRELDRVRAGDVVVVFYDAHSPLHDLLVGEGAEPAEHVESLAESVQPTA